MKQYQTPVSRMYALHTAGNLLWGGSNTVEALNPAPKREEAAEKF